MSAFKDRQPIICACGDHAFVAITRGLTTMVSPEDAHYLSAHKWCGKLEHDGKSVRATRCAYLGQHGGKKLYRRLDLAVAILQPASGMVVDHKSGDILDNRRDNLREATRQQNAQNRRSLNDLPVGVYRKDGKYAAQIGRVHLGTFETPEAASLAYRAAATAQYGEFTRHALTPAEVASAANLLEAVNARLSEAGRVTLRDARAA